ncbi:hypothetical protein CTAYLR_007444, partial [Chrysophaeum taylorii]
MCHPLVRVHVQFVKEAVELRAYEGEARISALFDLHRRKHQNPMFYCTKNEIAYGTLRRHDFDWDPIEADLDTATVVSATFLAQYFMPRLMRTNSGVALVRLIRELELDGKMVETSAARTVAAGTTPTDDDGYFLELCSNAFSALENVAIAVVGAEEGSSRKVVHANVPGFEQVTGHVGTTLVGQEFGFLNGPKTSEALVKKLDTAWADESPKAVKLIQHKKNGKEFHCLVALHPIYVSATVDGDTPKNKRYQIVAYVDMEIAAGSDDRVELLTSVDGLFAGLPRTMMCDCAHDVEVRALWPRLVDDDVAKAQISKAAANANLKKDSSKVVSNIQPGTYLDDHGRPIAETFSATAAIDLKTALANSSWLTKAETALGLMLETTEGYSSFGAFLDMEGNRPILDFYTESIELKRRFIAGKIPNSEIQGHARRLLKDYNAKMAQAKVRTVKDASVVKCEEIANACGLAHHDRTPETAEVWRQLYDGACVTTEVDVYNLIVCDARNTLRMLAIDSFPRYLLSQHSSALSNLARSGADDAKARKAAEAFSRAGASLLPRNIDQWLHALIAAITSWPTCIVVADMTIAGAPMVYVNPKFCETTGYKYKEAVGRNCRFLQGPATERKSKEVISRTLAAAQDCHVLITNYKKSGSKFSNLLTMRPIIDADGIYRYCIGVQFEITDTGTIPTELGRLDKLLQLLPRHLPFQGVLPRPEHLPEFWDGYDHSQSAVASSDISPARIRPSSPRRRESSSSPLSSPKGRDQMMVMKGSNSNGSLLDAASFETRVDVLPQRFAFTRLRWLLTPPETMRTIIGDDLGMSHFESHLSERAGPILYSALQFIKMFHDILESSDEAERKNKVLKLHSQMNNDTAFYFTTSDIDVGAMDRADWFVTFQDMSRWYDTWIGTFARAHIALFLNSIHGAKMFLALRKRELEKKTWSRLLTVCSAVVNPASRESLFLDMLHGASSPLKDIGLVASDMRVPGLPLIYINAGFTRVTGYGKGQIGLPCSFLQGAKSESFIIQEIVDALRSENPLVCKLHNYTQAQQAFQCLFTLNPVHDESDGYIFQIGLQVDMTAERTPQEMVSTLLRMADVTYVLP